MNGRLIIHLVLLLLAGSGCAGHSRPVHFYMLRSLTVANVPPLSPSDARRGPVVGLGPVRIPSYLDRPQIVTAITDEEYKLAEDHRWAERLDDTITRLLAENLSALVPTERVVLYPWPREQRVNMQVSVDIQEFHADAGGAVRLTAHWAVRQDRRTVLNRKSRCRAPASSTDYQQIVDAQSYCIDQLSREIANALRTTRE